MDDAVFLPSTTQTEEHPPLRRRNSNSAAIFPTKLAVLLHHDSSSTATSSSSDDLYLLSMKPNSLGYTSLRDMIPSSTAAASPKTSSAHSGQPGSEISIRNRLVKQAAWAYLQPMSTSPSADGDGFFRRVWPRVAALFDFVRRSVVGALSWAFRVIWIRRSR